MSRSAKLRSPCFACLLSYSGTITTYSTVTLSTLDTGVAFFERLIIADPLCISLIEGLYGKTATIGTFFLNARGLFVHQLICVAYSISTLHIHCSYEKFFKVI